MKKAFGELVTRKPECIRDKRERLRSEMEPGPSAYSKKGYHRICRVKEGFAHEENQSFIQVNNVPARFVNVTPESGLIDRRKFHLTVAARRSAITKPKASTEIIDQRFKMINEIYNIRQPDAVRSFVAPKKLLVSKVTNVFKKIRQQFPSENIFLEVYSSPNYPEEKEVLISVSTKLSPSDAIERIDRVDDDLWVEDSNKSFINICLKLEYQ